jgi:hypothetical protein
MSKFIHRDGIKSTDKKSKLLREIATRIVKIGNLEKQIILGIKQNG